MEDNSVLKGVQFVVNADGNKTVVTISLDEWRELWEDIYDVLVSEARKGEPTIAWETLKAELHH